MKKSRRNLGGRHQLPITVTKKPQRNDLCPCGSGEKYKHCCINKKLYR